MRIVKALHALGIRDWRIYARSFRRMDNSQPNHKNTRWHFVCIVSWSWGSGQPGGKVAEVKEQGEIAIESKRGNTIKKNASPNNPAVHVERSGNDVVKRASELQIEEKAEGANGQQSNGDSKEEDDEPAEAETEDKGEKPTESEKRDEEMKDASSVEEKEEDAQPNGGAKAEATKDEAKEDAKDESKDDEKSEDDEEEVQTGDKRKVEDGPSEKAKGTEADKDEPATKKPKKDSADGEAETKSKKAGRPKASEKKEKKEPAKKKEPKKAATADGQPRRSGRNKA
jgi:hypothetical protein